MCGQNEHRNRVAAGETLALPLRQVWVYRANQPPQPAWPPTPRLRSKMDFDCAPHPVVAGNLVVIASNADDTIRALNAENGRVLWRFTANGPIRFAPQLWEGKVYFGSNNGNIYALDAKSGRQLWQFSTGSELLSGGVAEGGMVFFNNTNDTLHALDGETGEVLWRYHHESSGIYAIRSAGSPAVSDGIIYVGFRDGTVAAFVSFDGSILWKNRVTLKSESRFKDIDASPVVDGEAIYVTSYDGGLFKLSSKTGELVWMHAGGSVATPTFDETRVYCSDKNGLIYALDKLSGETIWTYQLKKGTATSGTVIGDYYVVGSNYKRIYMIDKASGKVKSKRRLSGGLSASPAFYKGYIYALSNKGDAYAFGR